MSPHLSMTAYRTIVSLFHVVAFACSSFRLYRRFRLQKPWWDDHWACFAFVLDIIHFFSICLRQEIGGGTKADPAERHRRVVLFWITSTVFPLVVWSARISICLSIARIDIQRSFIRARLWVYALTVAFGLVGFILLCQKIWVCSRTTAWHHNNDIHCVIGKTVGYISLGGDIVADSLLTIISLRLLWKVRMRRSRRRLLSWLFGANILSSLAGLPFAVLVFCANKLGPARTILISLSAHVKTATTVIVCNLLVVATYVYARFWSSEEESDSEWDDTPATGGHSHLPGGRSTKPSGVRHNTVMFLTDVNTEGSVAMSWHQRMPGQVTSTFMTWAGSELGFVPRSPPAGRNIPTSEENAREDNLRTRVGPSALSEPSSSGHHTSDCPIIFAAIQTPDAATVISDPSLNECHKVNN